MCWSCTYWSASQAWRAYSTASVDRQARAAVLLQHRAEVDALDQLHHQVVDALLVLEVVEHLDDARVLELREQARLDLETRGVPGVEQALDATGWPLTRFVARYTAPIAPCEMGLDRVPAEPGSPPGAQRSPVRHTPRVGR